MMEHQAGGIHLPRLGLWVDPQRARPGHVFVSHAHADHIAAHPEVLLTEPTAWLMRHRLGGKRSERLLKFGEPVEVGRGREAFSITALPAGHILGSAMAYVQAGGESLLYTGDFKLRAGLAAERCEPRPADYLVMETTFGRPKYVFPDEQTVFQDIIAFCRGALAERATPVLFVYSLGKCQEVLAGLREAGLPIVLHKEAAKLTRVYEHFGRTFPPYSVFDGSNAADAVLVAPPQSSRSVQFQQLSRIRTAVITGWAIDSSCRFRSGTDAAFPLSDHADFPGLIEFVRRVSPRKVFTVHGFAADFARTLRELGYDAQALSEPEQLDLSLGVASSHLDGFLT